MSNKSYNLIKILILALIAVLLVLLLAVLLSKNGWSMFSFDFGRKAELVFTSEYNSNDINRVYFDLKSVDLDVRYSSNDNIKLEVYDKEDKNVSVNDESGLLQVKFSRNSSICFGICYTDRKAILYLPKEYKGDLEANSSSGDVFIDDYENIKGIIKTASGDVKVSRMDEVNVTTVSGDIEILNAKNANVSSTSGELKLRNISELKFQTTSGDIEIENANNIVGKTTSGEFDGDYIDGKIEFNSISGDVDLEFVTLKENSSITTVSGEVELKLITPVNVDVSTVSGDKDIYNIDRNSNITLKISTTSGDIEVK